MKDKYAEKVPHSFYSQMAKTYAEQMDDYFATKKGKAVPKNIVKNQKHFLIIKELLRRVVVFIQKCIYYV